MEDNVLVNVALTSYYPAANVDQIYKIKGEVLG